MENINKTTLQEFRKAFNDAVNDMSARYDVSIQMGNIRYDDHGFSFKVDVVNSNDPEKAERIKFESALDRYGWKYDGLTKDHYGFTFEHLQLGMCKLVKIKPRSPKQPMIIEALSSGKRYKVNYELVKAEIELSDKKQKEVA
jgi:hypothetical protein